MTTDNATELRAGTLVLHDQRALMLAAKSPCGRERFARDAYGSPFKIPTSAIVIGHSDDGWRIHVGSQCPVGADERVEVWFSEARACWRGSRAGHFVFPNGWDRIVAYRVLAPNPTHQEAEAVASVEPTPSDPQPIAPNDLRAGDRFSAEFVVHGRNPYSRSIIVGRFDGKCLEISEKVLAAAKTLHLLSREPEPLKRGDQVTWGCKVENWTIVHIEDGEAMLKGPYGYFRTKPLSELQPITPEKA